MRHRLQATLAVIGIAGMLGCTQKPPTAAIVIEDRVYSVQPDALIVKAGIVAGEISDLKVVEGVEENTGRVAVPAKLSGTLKLKNVSQDQTVRLVALDILYVDADGQLIPLEDSRTPATVRLGSSRTERLDPGQDASEQVSVEFPSEALKAKRLRDIRIDITYLPAAFRQQRVDVPVSIGGQ